VSIGQTVAAGLSTPSLFLIAKDLTRMQVWVSVNEADIARVYPGQPVTFTVDALPNETFRGEVCKVRPNASMTQNVVTFTVEITTDNSAGRLRPYLTANVRFEVSRRSNVLLVPTTALGWTPTVGQVAPEYREQPAGVQGEGQTPATKAASDMTPGVLWVVQGQYVRPVPVLAGQSDGANIEVTGEGLKEGLEIVTGTESATVSGQGDAGNPFMPKMPKPPKVISGGGGPPPV
jgi:HlyD family secretion protein